MKSDDLKPRHIYSVSKSDALVLIVDARILYKIQTTDEEREVTWAPQAVRPYQRTNVVVGYPCYELYPGWDKEDLSFPIPKIRVGRRLDEWRQWVREEPNLFIVASVVCAPGKLLRELGPEPKLFVRQREESMRTVVR